MTAESWPPARKRLEIAHHRCYREWLDSPCDVRTALDHIDALERALRGLADQTEIWTMRRSVGAELIAARNAARVLLGETDD